MNAPISTSDLALDLGPRFEALYRENYGFVWRCARRMCVEDGDVEDVIQDVFVIAYRRLGTLTPGVSPSTWLFGIMRNVIRNRARGRGRSQRRVHALARDVDASERHRRRRETELGEHMLADELLHGFLRELDEPQRTVFVLAELEGRSAKEIAEALAINPNTASSRLRLARRAFCVHFGLEPARGSVHEATRTLREQPEQPDATVQNRAWGLLLAAVAKPGALATGGLLSLASAKLVAVLGSVTMVAAVTVLAVQAEPRASTPPVMRSSASPSAADRDTHEAVIALAPELDPELPAVVVQAPQPRPRPSSASLSASPSPSPGPGKQIPLARAALVSGDPERALELLDALDPADDRMHDQRVATQVAALCKLGEVDRARTIVEELRAADPTAPVLEQLDGACW